MASGSSRPRRIVLDTSAYSRFRAGDNQVADWIARAETVLLPVATLAELEAGFGLGTRSVENLRVLDEFLAEPFVSTLPATPDVARRWAQVFVSLRKAGTPIGSNDIWIAASTLDAGAHLLTFDADFRKIASLDCTVLRK